MPETFKDSKDTSNWHHAQEPKLVGRGRKNLFPLSTWCTGPSGPENDAKGNEYMMWLTPEDGCFPHKMTLVTLMSVMLTVLSRVWEQGVLVTVLLRISLQTVS